VAQIAQVPLVLVKVQTVRILYLAQLLLLAAALLVVGVEQHQIIMVLMVALAGAVENLGELAALVIHHLLAHLRVTMVVLLVLHQAEPVAAVAHLLLVQLVQQAATVERELHRL